MKMKVEVELEIPDSKYLDVCGFSEKEYMEMVLFEALREMQDNNMCKVYGSFETSENFISAAYTACMAKDGWIVGLAELGTRGYSPLPIHGKFESYTVCTAKCDELNKELGISMRKVHYITARTMRK